MIRIEGIPIVAARLAAGRVERAQRPRKTRGIAKIAARSKSLSVIRVVRKRSRV